jgi:hypothetical protein
VYEAVPGQLPALHRRFDQFWRATEYSPMR